MSSLTVNSSEGKSTLVFAEIAKTDRENASHDLLPSSSPPASGERQFILVSPETERSCTSVLTATKTHAFDQGLHRHRSDLPLAFYLLSFSPPFRPFSSKTTWRETFTHPYVFYAIGAFVAALAGIVRPVLNLMYGYWSTGVLRKETTPAQLTGRGAQVGWILTIVGLMMFLCSWIFLFCCEYCPLIRCEILMSLPQSLQRHRFCPRE